jgi:(2R)-sulfolactate sulfo-lyase subunit alpha
MSPLILLHPDDNVLVCCAAVQRGDRLFIDRETVAAVESIDVGHKVSRRALAPGEKVIKYGAPIGSMTQSTPRGAHVHLHNMTSDYLPSHTRLTVGGGGP